MINALEIRKLILFFVSLSCILTASFFSSDFLSTYYSVQFVQDISLLVLLALPLMLIFLSGGVDLSLGGIYFLSLSILHFWRERVFDQSTNFSNELRIAIFVCLGSALLGAAMGWAIARRRQFSMMLTLAVAIALGAIGMKLSPAPGPWADASFLVDIFISPQLVMIIATVVMVVGSVQAIRYFFPEFDWIKPVLALVAATSLSVFIVFEYEGLPVVSLLAIGSVILVFFLLHQTIFGRSLVAVGDNWRAAELAGVSVRKIFIFSFALLGLFVSLASMFETRSISHENFLFAYERQLDAIVAVLAGGVSFRGGYGSIAGVMMGVLMVSSINLLPTFLGFPIFIIICMKAFLIFLSIYFDPARKRS